MPVSPNPGKLERPKPRKLDLVLKEMARSPRTFLPGREWTASTRGPLCVGPTERVMARNRVSGQPRKPGTPKSGKHPLR